MWFADPTAIKECETKVKDSVGLVVRFVPCDTRGV